MTAKEYRELHFGKEVPLDKVPQDLYFVGRRSGYIPKNTVYERNGTYHFHLVGGSHEHKGFGDHLAYRSISRDAKEGR